jgi:hypothetical protein
MSILNPFHIWVRRRCKRILLVNPLSPLHLHAVTPLSLAYLSGQLRRDGFEPIVIDASARNRCYPPDKVLELAQDVRPDIIGITIMTPFAPHAYDCIEKLKSLCVPVIAGGAGDEFLRGSGVILPAELLPVSSFSPIPLAHRLKQISHSSFDHFF